MAVYMIDGDIQTKNDFEFMIDCDEFILGRRSLSNITSSWARNKYPNAKYVANYVVIFKSTGKVNFYQIYF